jgi:hypothetical protein
LIPPHHQVYIFALVSNGRATPITKPHRCVCTFKLLLLPDFIYFCLRSNAFWDLLRSHGLVKGPDLPLCLTLPSPLRPSVSISNRYAVLGRTADARSALKEALRIKVMTFGPVSFEAVVALTNYGRVCLEAGGDLDDAFVALVRAHTTCKLSPSTCAAAPRIAELACDAATRLAYRRWR